MRVLHNFTGPENAVFSIKKNNVFIIYLGLLSRFPGENNMPVLVPYVNMVGIDPGEEWIFHNIGF